MQRHKPKTNTTWRPLLGINKFTKLTLFPIVSILVLFGCKPVSSPSKRIPTNKSVAEAVDDTIKSKVDLSYNVEIELAALLMLLADRMDESNQALAVSAKSRFSQYKHHPAVANTKQLYDAIGIDGVVRISWHLSGTKTLTANSWPEHLINQLEFTFPGEGQALLDRFSESFRSFQSEASFDEYLSEQTTNYTLAKQQLALLQVTPDLLSELEAYFNHRPNQYHLVVSLLFQTGGNIGFQSSAESSDLNNFIFMTGPYFPTHNAGLAKGELGFTNPKLEAERPGFLRLGTQIMAIHEYGHGFITDALKEENNRQQIAKSDSYFHEISSDMKRQGYHNWWSVFNEHAVRAAEIRLAETQRDPQRVTVLRDRYENMLSFDYLKSFENAWKYFEKVGPNGTGDYQNFTEFSPHYIKLVSEELNQNQSQD